MQDLRPRPAPRCAKTRADRVRSISVPIPNLKRRLADPRARTRHCTREISNMPPVGEGASTEDGSEEHVLLPRRADGTPIKCLVVEDEELIALDLAERLEDWGADSAVAPTVAAALRLHREIQPDLVLLDVRLPDGDGVEVAQKMREASDVAIVFVTGAPDALKRTRIRGDFAVVRKPVDFRRLRRSIHQELARRTAQRQEP